MLCGVGVRPVSLLPRVSSNLSFSQMSANQFSRASVKLTSGASNPQLFTPLLGHKKGICASRFHQRSHVCFIGGKDEFIGENKGSPWKATDNAKGGFKKSSIEDVLKNQIEKKEYYDGGKGGGGRGGRGGGGDGSGEPEGADPSKVIREIIQVVLATIGSFFLYICLISGEEFFLLIRDYTTYLFRGTKSGRLIQVMDKWRRIYQKLRGRGVYSNDW